MMERKLDHHLGAQVHLVRVDAEITQADLAKFAGVSIPTVRECERSRGTIRSFLKIANTLGCMVHVGARDGPEITSTILAAHRKSIGVSQRDAAALTGLSQPTIIALETRLAGRLESLVRLTQVLGISLHVELKERPRRTRNGARHLAQPRDQAQQDAATARPRPGLVRIRNKAAADTANESFIACQVVHDLCDKPAPWRNMVIEGNNLDALQWLRMTMAGRVKCIFIDPPYNTGNIGWVYNDRYGHDEDHDRQSTWLEFLHRRLTLACDLLAEDGVILVTINDKQRAEVELLMDEVMPKGRVGTFVWRTRNGSNADQTANLSQDHEHILVYAKPGFAFSGKERSLKGYSNPDGDRRGDWQPVSIRLGFSRGERPNLYYPLQDPETGIWYPCNPDSVWRFATRDRVDPGMRLQTQPIEDFIVQGRIKFPGRQLVRVFDTLDALFRAIDAGEVPASSGVPILRRDLPDIEFWVGKKIGYGTPVRKLFLSELRKPTQPLSSWISRTAEVDSVVPDNQIVAGSNTEAARTVREIFGYRAFNYAKPVSLVRELIRQAAGPTDVILDFFAGSGTTAQGPHRPRPVHPHRSRRVAMIRTDPARARGCARCAPPRPPRRPARAGSLAGPGTRYRPPRPHGTGRTRRVAPHRPSLQPPELGHHRMLLLQDRPTPERNLQQRLHGLLRPGRFLGDTLGLLGQVHPLRTIRHDPHPVFLGRLRRQQRGIVPGVGLTIRHGQLQRPQERCAPAPGHGQHQPHRPVLILEHGQHAPSHEVLLLLVFQDRRVVVEVLTGVDPDELLAIRLLHRDRRQHLCGRQGRVRQGVEPELARVEHRRLSHGAFPFLHIQSQ